MLAGGMVCSFPAGVAVRLVLALLFGGDGWTELSCLVKLEFGSCCPCFKRIVLPLSSACCSWAPNHELMCCCVTDAHRSHVSVLSPAGSQHPGKEMSPGALTSPGSFTELGLWVMPQRFLHPSLLLVKPFPFLSDLLAQCVATLHKTAAVVCQVPLPWPYCLQPSSSAKAAGSNKR